VAALLKDVADLVYGIQDRLDVLLGPILRPAVVEDDDSQSVTPAREGAGRSLPLSRRQAIRTTD
jgi:hypothetical protein